MSQLEKVENEICQICISDVDDVFRYGDKYRFGPIVAHYFCLLFSCALEQKGDDSEGINGFLIPDIQKEISRGKKLRCKYCKKTGATSACCVGRCHKTFHLRCALENDSLHQFFDSFSSYCSAHRPFQTFTEACFESNVNDECPICFLDIDKGERLKFHSLLTPCCKRIIHRDCLQRQSLSAGYFFRCPLCNNETEFLNEMKMYGVYIPERDASWELEENAYDELLERYSRCDATTCQCPRGREFDEDPWNIIICALCASHGAHTICGKIENEELLTWKCSLCSRVESERASQST